MKGRVRVCVWTAVMVAAGLPARADLADFKSGTTSSGNESVSGTADFVVVSSTELDLTLANTSTVSDIGRILDGLVFTVNGTSSLTLTGVTASNGTVGGGSGDFVDCTSGTCKSVSTFFNYDNNPQMFPGCDSSGNCVSPYGWGLEGTQLGAGDKNGSISWKPAGIVNSTVNVPNGEHNDLLYGPVTFKFTDFYNTNLITGVSGVTFDWGTTPDTTSGTPCSGADCGSGTGQGGQVPEPTSIFLLAPVAAWLLFKRKRQNVY